MKAPIIDHGDIEIIVGHTISEEQFGKVDAVLRHVYEYEAGWQRRLLLGARANRGHRTRVLNAANAKLLRIGLLAWRYDLLEAAVRKATGGAL